MIKPMPEIVAEAKANLNCLTLPMVKSLIENEDTPLLIDVREAAEHSVSNAKGFINIPCGVLEMKISDVTQDPDKCIILHCGTGGRAALAAESLVRMGYRNVHLINAGYEDIFAAFGH